MVLAHAGDCRAVLVRRDGAARPYEVLTRDHTAEEVPGREGQAFFRPDEAGRILRAGAKVEEGYVHVGDNSLPMTRAFGNVRLKVAEGADWRQASVAQQVVTALPEVSVRARSADDLALVLASDGLWGSEAEALMSSEEVAAETRRVLLQYRGREGAETKAARRLVECALREYNGSDNTTIIVVALEPASAPLPAVESRGPVPLEHVGSQQSLTTAPAYSPGRISFADKLNMPFLQAFAPCGESAHSSDVADSP